MKPPEIVTATRGELDEILALSRPILPARHYELLQGVLGTYEFVMLEVQSMRTSIRRLRRMLFGAPTERRRNLLEDAAGAASASAGAVQDAAGEIGHAVAEIDAAVAPEMAAAPTKPKRKGHGRNAAHAYRDARVLECEHADLRPGQRCPQCGSGRIYESSPKVVVKIVGQAPLAATVYRLQQLRCRLCEALFTAPAPEAAAVAAKYDASCASMIALLRYGNGMPFHRLQELQSSLGVPLPDATQWDIVSQAVNAPRSVYEELIRQAAQAPLLHNDDTPARVLALMAERKKAEAAGRPTAKAINTSGIVALLGEQQRVVLFFTGHAHAGDNLHKVLAQRARELAPPMQMCDALASNMAGEFVTVLCHCLAHGRRKVIDVLEHFPEQGRHVIELLGRVYANDEHCREHTLSAEQRLAYHQQYSEPLMKGKRRLEAVLI